MLDDGLKPDDIKKHNFDVLKDDNLGEVTNPLLTCLAPTAGSSSSFAQGKF